jgi:hypothetical protein
MSDVNDTQEMSVSEMVRVTGNNTVEFLTKIAGYIDELEARVQELEEELNALK